MKIILPKTYHTTNPQYGPVFFLAGPVGGGDDWQFACCQEIARHLSDFYVAIPISYQVPHPLVAYTVAGDGEEFDRLLTWERHYLDVAAKKGAVIFWLPEESKTRPRRGGNPYAMDTRGELGEWRGRLMYDLKLKVVVGAETGFPGLSQIKRNFNLALGTDFPIHTSLANTVAAAVALATETK